MQIAVDVELVRRGSVDKLEAVRLQHRVVAEFGVEPGKLDKEQRVGQAQIIFQISEVVVAAQPAAQHLVAFETEIGRLGVGADVIEKAPFQIRHQMAVARRAQRDRDRGGQIAAGGVDPHPVSAVDQPLRLGEILLQAREA